MAQYGGDVYANTSANEPYTSLIEESIIFNGSRSCDSDGTYLLDIYGDGSWDYMYNTTGHLSTYQEKKNKETPCFELIIVLYAMSITIFLKRKRKS